MLTELVNTLLLKSDLLMPPDLFIFFLLIDFCTLYTSYICLYYCFHIFFYQGTNWFQKYAQASMIDFDW